MTGLQKKTKIYDDEFEEVQLSLGKEAKNNLSHSAAENNFDFLGFNYNYSIPVPSFGANPDEGFFVGFGVTSNTFKFKRSQIHKWGGTYAFGNNAFAFNYEGDYFNTTEHWDTYLRVDVEVPQFV